MLPLLMSALPALGTLALGAIQTYQGFKAKKELDKVFN